MLAGINEGVCSLSEIVLKVVGLAVFLGFVTVILPDGNVKSFAKMGLGLVFAASLLLPVTALVNGTGGENIAAYAAGRLRSLFMTAEIKEQLQGSATLENGDAASAVIEEYTARLTKEAKNYVFAETGFLTEPTFIVCGDITSADFGKLEFVHCKVIGKPDPEEESTSGAATESENKGTGGKKIKPIKKIEITIDGIYINGENIFGKDDGSTNREPDREEEERERIRIQAAITEALQKFCGIEASKCNVFW